MGYRKFYSDILLSMSRRVSLHNDPTYVFPLTTSVANLINNLRS